MARPPRSLQEFFGLIFLLTVCTAAPSPAQFSQQGSKLVGSGAIGTLVYQGTSVAVSADGNTAIVGATRDNGSIGATWVFVRTGTVWSQQGAKLIGSGAGGTTVYQGGAVALSSDGNTAVVGGYADNNYEGAAWVFTRTGTTWSQQGTKLVGTGATGVSWRGTSVAISADGNTILVGGPYDNSYAGAVWVFVRNGGVWSQQGNKLVGSQGVSGFQGASVALSADGNTALVGGSGDNGGVGAAWVFTRSGTTWTQQGGKLVGTGYAGGGNQGGAVALSSDGNTALVAGPLDNGANGAMWVFTRTGTTWSQQGNKLVGTGNVGVAEQGYSVSLSGDGNKAVMGGYRDNGYVGASWVFRRSGTVWTQQGSKIIGTGATGNAHQGKSVRLSTDGRTLLVGGQLDNGGIGATWAYFDPTTPVAEAGALPDRFALEQNYPNPFNPETNIRFTLPDRAEVSLTVHNALGQQVATLERGTMEAGSHEARFDATGLPSGVYLYTLRAGGYAQTKKLLLLR